LGSKKFMKFYRGLTSCRSWLRPEGQSKKYPNV